MIARRAEAPDFGGRKVASRQSDADSSDPGAQRRPWTREDAECVPRAPSGSARHRSLIRAASTIATGRRVHSRRIQAHPGFARWGASSPACLLYQMVDANADSGAEHLRPAHDTPKLTVGHGGCFGCIYSVRGAAFTNVRRTPCPIYDPNRISAICAISCACSSRRHREVKPIDRVARTRASPCRGRPLLADHP